MIFLQPYFCFILHQSVRLNHSVFFVVVVAAAVVVVLFLLPPFFCFCSFYCSGKLVSSTAKWIRSRLASNHFDMILLLSLIAKCWNCDSEKLISAESYWFFVLFVYLVKVMLKSTLCWFYIPSIYLYTNVWNICITIFVIVKKSSKLTYIFLKIVK